jgi:Fe-S cluster assembly iron-binding protein IscA
MAITLTEKAAKHVSRYMERRGKGIGLRFGVRTTGCSGMAYKLEYVDEVGSDDQVLNLTASKCLSIRKACLTSTVLNSTSRAKA